MTSLANSQRVAIRVSWSQKTCYPPDQDQWSEKNPSLGQCAVTALLVQDLVGGNILFDAGSNHYWNQIPGRDDIDLTRIQFPEGTTIGTGTVVVRGDLLEGAGGVQARTKERYEQLKAIFEEYLRNTPQSQYE